MSSVHGVDTLKIKAVTVYIYLYIYIYVIVMTLRQMTEQNVNVLHLAMYSL